MLVSTEWVYEHPPAHPPLSLEPPSASLLAPREAAMCRGARGPTTTQVQSIVWLMEVQNVESSLQ